MASTNQLKLAPEFGEFSTRQLELDGRRWLPPSGSMPMRGWNPHFNAWPGSVSNDVPIAAPVALS
jgi:hypothetical protein